MDSLMRLFLTTIILPTLFVIGVAKTVIDVEPGEIGIEIDSGDIPTGVVITDPGIRFVKPFRKIATVRRGPVEVVAQTTGITPSGESLKVSYKLLTDNFQDDLLPELVKRGIYKVSYDVSHNGLRLTFDDVLINASMEVVSHWIALGRPPGDKIGQAVGARLAREIAERGFPRAATQVPLISLSILSVEKTQLLAERER